MKKFLAAVLASVLLFAICGCSLVKKNDPKKCTIELEGNPTTGYTWSCEIANKRIVRLCGEPEYETDNKDPNMVGVGGKYTFTFEGVLEGETDVAFTYSQNWEGGSFGKSVIYHFTVDAEKNITAEEVK